jgi:hypothetical protein
MTGCSRSLARIRLVRLVALVVISVETASLAQGPDETKPPPILNSADSFSTHRLSQPFVVDGREWIAADVATASAPGTVPVPTQAFALTLANCGDVGDFVRCELFFQRGPAAPIRIDVGFTGWVFVTPDARYIITEPLYILDVGEWRHYKAFEALQIPNYTNIEAISRDGKHLFISRKDCAIDCKDAPVEYYELTLP